MFAFVFALLLAAVLGFAAHRASVCTVRAVAEVMHSRTAYMAASIGKTVAWIVLVTLPFFWLTSSSGPYFGGWQLTATAVLGGFLFGAGAGINGACAYSTMARMMDGEGRMLATVAGFACGVFVFAALAAQGIVTSPRPAQTGVGRLVDWAGAVLIVLGLLAAYEFVRLWRSRPPGARLRDLIPAHQYRLSTAALLIGLTGAAIYLLFGSAGYSTTFELLIEGSIGTKPWPSATRWLLLLAVLSGMLLSTLQRGTFRLNLRPRIDWLQNLAGGALMALGVALAPGGNDT
jgi:uncharacterized membrane protein YedE/YeeE